MAQTKIANLVNPDVLSDMVSGKLNDALNVLPYVKIDTTLQGVPGNTITVPQYKYIGDAADVEEGADIATSQLTTSTTQATVKKACKAVELTDEAIYSGYGDPLGEAANQLYLASKAKIQADVLTTLVDDVDTDMTKTVTGIISYDAVVDACDLFNEEEQTPKVIFINSKQLTQLRKDEDFKDINKYPITNGVIMSGTIGQIGGCQVVVNNKVGKDSTNAYYLNPIIKLGSEAKDVDLPAVTVYIKKDVEVEPERLANKKSTRLNSSVHYAASLTNTSKAVILKCKVAAS